MTLLWSLQCITLTCYITSLQSLTEVVSDQIWESHLWWYLNIKVLIFPISVFNHNNCPNLPFGIILGRPHCFLRFYFFRAISGLQENSRESTEFLYTAYPSRHLPPSSTPHISIVYLLHRSCSLFNSWGDLLPSSSFARAFPLEVSGCAQNTRKTMVKRVGFGQRLPGIVFQLHLSLPDDLGQVI